MKITERQRVRAHNNRAKQLGALGTLTEEEWTETISAFRGMCAYCQSEPFTILEHFIPIDIAGTTANNCIPACRFCNNKKGDSTGSVLITKFGEDTINRIQAYLNNGQTPEVLEMPLTQIVRKTRPRRKLPPLQTVYMVDTEEWAERLRMQGKKAKVISLDDMAKRR